MTTLTLAPNPFDLVNLAKRITASSNFRFAWQFYNVTDRSVQTAGEAATSLNEMISRAECHQFLRETFVPMYEKEFNIHLLNQDALIVNAGQGFEKVMAGAANDLLGAYSRELREPSRTEVDKVNDLFGRAGPYLSFQLAENPSATTHGSYLFSNWFYGVAWDWCFVLSWSIY